MARVANLIGFDAERGGWAAAQATIGPGQTNRLFHTGALPVSFTSGAGSASDAYQTDNSITCIVSYTTMNTNVASYVNSIPQARNVIMIYHHEPEGDYALGSTFVSEFKSQADLIHAQGRTNVRVAMAASGYAYRANGTADVLAGNYLRGLGAGYADLFTKDIYQGSAGVGGWDWPSNGLANYPQWTNWLNLVTSPAVVGVARPLGITEYGVNNAVGNSARNTRIQLDATYLTSAFTPGGASAVSDFPLAMWCYWWSKTPGRDDNTFTDAATITTWQGYETAAATATAPYLIGSATLAQGVAAAVTVPVATPTTAGDVIVVSTLGSSSTVSSVTDTKNNVYTQRNSDVGGVGSVAYQYSADGGNNPGGTTPLTLSDTITVTWASASPSKSVIAAGSSGLAASSPLDQAVNADNAGSTSPSVTSAALASSGEIAIATEANATAGGDINWTGSWVDVAAVQNPNGPRMHVAWLAPPGTSAVTASGTITSAKWTMELLTFKPAGAVTVAVGLASEIDISVALTSALSSPPLQPAGGAPAYPSGGWPQIYTEFGFTGTQPVAVVGTFLLDDPVSGLLDTDKLGTATTWVDVAALARSISTARDSTRQQGPLITYQAGTCSIVLDNSDGRFDFGNTTGPFTFHGASQVTSMVPVQVRATYGSVEYHLFSGFTDAWSEAALDYDQGYDEVTVTATDGLKVLAGIRIPAVGDPAGAGELSGARVTRILNTAQWYTDHRLIGAGNENLQATSMGDTALTLLQLTADTEIGELYIDGAGNLFFRSRDAILTDARSTAPQGVFGDLPGTSHTAGAEIPYVSAGRANDDTQLANDVQITAAGSANMQRATDAASVAAKLFPRSYARTDVLLQSDIEAAGYAQWVLYMSKTGEDRFDTLTIDPAADPANLWPQVLGRQIGDRIQVWRHPQNSGQAITKDVFIRGISHDIDAVAQTWRTTWTLQDASKYQGFLILDDTAKGLLNTGVLAF